ncbi:sensor histidine kinase [Actinomadura sp. HBU206391]|uniref:sensor histidine kinase n=1 Tax=Actinomadura sp. HBU206391 TaxID=2731692 RepID=UPI001650BCE6|nr:HAMP domain-containing sensor histidine kinase [Actinomadura sp. HBU206391]MBC6461084.1 HAMP domain-containing histidine kinase [Actinomadura sp. HBU206391]
MGDLQSVRKRPSAQPGADRPAVGLRCGLGAVMNRAGAVRWRPRSIRGRMVLLVTVMAVLLLAPAGVIAAMVARQELTKSIWLEARQQAVLTAASVRNGQPADAAIVPRVPGIELIQVVAPGHHIIASSVAARGLPPMSRVWPSPAAPEQDVQTCALPRVGCVRISAQRVRAAPDSPVVYAGRPAPGKISPGVFDAIFAAQAAALLALAALATWKITGRTLRPVVAIRTELDAINGRDLGSRVPEPPGHDEIAQLARTVNSTLGRVEHAHRQVEQALGQQRQFTSDASHELRTPLAGLRMRLEEARLYPGETSMDDMLEHALNDVDRLEAITTDLLLLTRVAATTPAALEKVDLAELVEAEISLRADRLPTQLDLQSGVVVDAVPAQISRVLANLVDNAQRHAEHAVHVQVRCHRQHAELTVTDDGSGIAEPDRQRIFQRFARCDTARDRDAGGTGLGLAIAHDIATAHNGTLHVEESPTCGARFVLRLPLTGPEHRHGRDRS